MKTKIERVLDAYGVPRRAHDNDVALAGHVLDLVCDMLHELEREGHDADMMAGAVLDGLWNFKREREEKA